MAKVRLDQILLRKRLVTEEQIKQALLRQKSHPGPLGSHLMYYKHITEKDLVTALGEQFGIKGVELGKREIPPEVIQKIPAKIAHQHMVCPFDYDPETRTLLLATLGPRNADAVHLVKEASGVRHVAPYVAAESVLRNAIRKHYHGKEDDGPIDQIIELPDLFAGEGPSRAPDDLPEIASSSEEPALRKVLMVTKSAFLKGLLVSIFEREGSSLTVLGDKEEVLTALQECVYDHILVSEELETTFREWICSKDVPLPRGERSAFSSVSHALLDNHAPYHRMATSLIRALRRMAEYRSTLRGVKPLYALICKDAADLAGAVGLCRLAGDGVQVAALLLSPAGHAASGGPSAFGRLGPVCFESFDESLETAKDLCFPWDIYACLSLFSALLEGAPPRDLAGRGFEDISLAAQILALVWHRHAVLGKIEGSPEERLAKIKSGLQGQEKPLATPEVVEAYIRLLERRQGQTRTATRKDVFVVSGLADSVRPLTAHLRKEGYRIVEIKDLSEAVHLHERRRPDAIVIYYDDYPDQATRFSRFVRKESTTLLYALTTQNEPSLIMSLLDAGFDDVFAPPFNYEVITARMNKSLIA